MRKLTVAGAVTSALILAGCSGTELTEADYRATAVDTCHEALKKTLKAPSTAQFSEEQFDDGSDGTGIESAPPSATYKITGSVDSENSFGAMIRNTWTCTADRTGDNVHASAQLDE